VETIKWQTRDAHVCLVAGQSFVATDLAFSLHFVRMLCLWQRHCSCSCYLWCYI